MAPGPTGPSYLVGADGLFVGIDVACAGESVVRRLQEATMTETEWLTG